MVAFIAYVSLIAATVICGGFFVNFVINMEDSDGGMH